MIFITLSPSGGDYRWCLHVCKRPPSPEREETLWGDRQHGAGLVEWSHQLQDPPSSGVQAATSDWSSHGRVCRRGGRHGHAQVLLVRRHRQHGFQNGVYRKRYIGHFLIDAFIVTISEEIRLSSIFCLMIKMYLMWTVLTRSIAYPHKCRNEFCAQGSWLGVYDDGTWNYWCEGELIIVHSITTYQIVL